MVKEIRYPNTLRRNEQVSYMVGLNCDEIRVEEKNGEMAKVRWLAPCKGEYKIAEIKESICDIYYENKDI